MNGILVFEDFQLARTICSVELVKFLSRANRTTSSHVLIVFVFL